MLAPNFRNGLSRSLLNGSHFSSIIQSMKNKVDCVVSKEVVVFTELSVKLTLIQ